MSKAPSRLLQKIRTCKETGIIRKALLVDYTTGSDFQILEWAGDRHLKSLMTDIVMQTSCGLMDQGELSKLCHACESNDALARVFDIAGLAKLVDEGSVSTSQVGDVDKRKADVMEAIVAELHQKRAANEVANEALDMLVAFIYDIGRAHGSCRCDFRSSGTGEDSAPPPQQKLDKNTVSKLHEWAQHKEQKEKKMVTFPQAQLASGTWKVWVELDGASIEGASGEASDVKTAKITAAGQACRILNIC